jgi:hypothetical protein
MSVIRSCPKPSDWSILHILATTAIRSSCYALFLKIRPFALAELLEKAKPLPINLDFWLLASLVTMLGSLTVTMNPENVPQPRQFPDNSE